MQHRLFILLTDKVWKLHKLLGPCLSGGDSLKLLLLGVDSESGVLAFSNKFGEILRLNGRQDTKKVFLRALFAFRIVIREILSHPW